jgi:hypothetical protein
MRKLLFAICLSAIPAMAAEIYTFTVPAAENVSGPAGLSLTGWGYTIHNESSSLWLVTTGLSAGTFLHATPTVLFDFPDIAPGATIDVPYNPVTPAGLYQILWDANAPPGFVNSGTFTLTGQWWSGDPLNGGTPVANAPSETQPYSASFTAVPEPGTIGLAGLALFAVGVLTSIRRITSQVSGTKV